VTINIVNIGTDNLDANSGSFRDIGGIGVSRSDPNSHITPLVGG